MSMASITFALCQRAGLLLVIAFAVTRIPAIEMLWRKRASWRTAWVDSLIFGALGILATQLDLEWTVTGPIAHGLIGRLPADAMLIGPTLVATAISGLLGGPWVGLFAGILVGAWAAWQGGNAEMVNAFIHPLAGMLAGFIASFFAQERVLAPQKALFVGMFIPILHISLLLVFTGDSPESIHIANQIGLPLVMTNSLAIAIFTAIVQAAMVEREEMAARETERALHIAKAALPFLRQPLGEESARGLAHLLLHELRIAAVSVTNCTHVLAHVGLGEDHHRDGQPLQMKLAFIALETGEVQVSHDHDVIQCQSPSCPLHSAIMVPLWQSGEVIGLINLYFRGTQPARSVDMKLARGLGTLISQQLDTVAAVHMKTLVQEARLRNLQAQVNPHFLFNTLQMISALIRVNPDGARNIVAKLGDFMRHNLRVTVNSSIPLAQEVEHLQAYMDIVRMRFSDQLDFQLTVDDAVLHSAVIPPGTIQPLVENSIKHGVEKTNRQWFVRVGIRREGAGVRVAVLDDGDGIPPSALPDMGNLPSPSGETSGFGLYNVHQRLIGLFGSEAGLCFEHRAGEGFEVSFRIPDGEMKEDCL